MAALWRRTLLALTRSTRCFWIGFVAAAIVVVAINVALIYAVRRYRAERGAEPRQVRGGPRASSSGSAPCSPPSRRRSSSSASSTPTRRGRRRPPGRPAFRSPTPKPLTDRGDRPAVAVALRLPERSLLLLQAGRPGRHRRRPRPRLHRRRPHLGRARPRRQARRGPRQAQPRRLPRRRRRRLLRAVGDPLRPGLRGDADRGRSRLARGIRRLHRAPEDRHPGGPGPGRGPDRRAETCHERAPAPRARRRRLPAAPAALGRARDQRRPQGRRPDPDRRRRSASSSSPWSSCC